MNTVQFILYVQLVRYLVNRRQAASKLITDVLQAPGHLGGVHGAGGLSQKQETMAHLLVKGF